MKKLISSVTVCFLMLGLLAVPGICQDANDIIEKMIEATGGRKVFEGIKDTTITGEMEIVQMGINGSMTMYHKEPNKFRQDMEFMGMAITNAFDGEVAWMINPQTGTVEDLPEEQLEESKKGALGFGNSALLYPEKFGITYSLKGKESIEGNECFVIEQKFANDDTSLMYIDAKTYLMYSIKQKSRDMTGGEVDQEMVFSDYKKVDGILYAHSMTIFQNGEEFGLFTTTEIKFNSGLEDSLFEKE